MQVEFLTKDEARQLIFEAFADAIKDITRVILPKQLRTEQAANVLGISENALHQRKNKGEYIEGLHYFQKGSAKMILWDRDALLEMKGKK